MRADDGVGGALAEAGERVEALEGRDEEVDVVQGQVRDQGVEEGTLPRETEDRFVKSVWSWGPTPMINCHHGTVREVGLPHCALVQ